MCDIFYFFFQEYCQIDFSGVDFIKGNFDFLEKTYGDLFELADGMEKTVYTDPDSSTMKGNKFLELLVESIYDVEGLRLKGNLAQDISRLKEFNIIGYELKEKFHSARRIRNDAVHNKRVSTDKEAFRLAALLYTLSVWFYKKYGNDDSFRKVPPFNKSLIIDKNNASKIVEPPIDEPVGGSKKIIQNPISSDDEIINEDENDFKQYKGSYLLNELSKLKKSSKESVKDASGFKDSFNEYMHINRKIQDEFEFKLEELKNNANPQLIMLAGSTGDGKSHLLSYMQDKKPELMEHYEVHNDATESFDPNLTAIQTLFDVLNRFSDENLNNHKNNSKNLILAVNLGILSDLLDDDYFVSNFSILGKLLDEANVFDISSVTKSTTNDFLTVINFNDYPIYELNNAGVYSEFILALIDKITNSKSSVNNPFFKAYQLDVKNNFTSPIIYNYEMLMNPNVKEIVVQTLLKSIVKNKKIVSTRALINALYEILVPPFIKDYDDMSNVYKYLNDLLPILLFNTNNRSNVLYDISLDSPLNIRCEEIDNLIISSNTLSIDSVIDKYFDEYKEFDFFKSFLLSNKYRILTKSQQNEIKDALIYFVLFFGKDTIKEAFLDEYYQDFVNYLYYYNYNPKKLRNLFTKIKKAIFSWRGTIDKDYIILDNLSNYEVGKKIIINFKPMNDDSTISESYFNNNIVFNIFVDNDVCGECLHDSCTLNKCIKLNVDYLLFEAISKINRGYKPNKKERNNLKVFDDFILEILSKSKSNEVIIHHKYDNKLFRFEKDYSGYYNFEEA